MLLKIAKKYICIQICIFTQIKKSGLDTDVDFTKGVNVYLFFVLQWIMIWKQWFEKKNYSQQSDFQSIKYYYIIS